MPLSSYFTARLLGTGGSVDGFPRTAQLPGHKHIKGGLHQLLLWTCWLCCAGKTIFVSAKMSTSEVRAEVHRLQQYIRQKEEEIEITLRGIQLTTNSKAAKNVINVDFKDLCNQLNLAKQILDGPLTDTESAQLRGKLYFQQFCFFQDHFIYSWIVCNFCCILDSTLDQALDCTFHPPNIHSVSRHCNTSYKIS